MQQRSSWSFLWLLALLALVTLAACGRQPPPVEQATLTVTAAGSGSGNVTSDPAGIDLDEGDTSAVFDVDTTITLTAVAAEGSTFSGWSDPECSGTEPCTITLTEDTTVTATFTLNTYTLTVGIDGSGSGSGNVTSVPAGIDLDAGDSGAVFDHGTTVTLSAEAAPGSLFAGWTSGGCSGTDPCTIVLTSDLTVTADFFDPTTDTTTNTFTIQDGSDDAEEFLSNFGNPFYSRGGTTLGSSDLDFTWDADFDVEVVVGLRFASVTLPENAVITGVAIEFTRRGTTAGPGQVTLSFAGEASDDAPTFLEGQANFNITSRTTTTETVDWFSESGWGTTATTPDLTPVFSEVVQRAGWENGNAVAFIVSSTDSDASNYRRAISYEFDPDEAPRLRVTYYAPTTP